MFTSPIQFLFHLFLFSILFLLLGLIRPGFALFLHNLGVRSQNWALLGKDFVSLKGTLLSMQRNRNEELILKEHYKVYIK